jgi:hypothetical protein
VNDEIVCVSSLDPAFCRRLEVLLVGAELRAGPASPPPRPEPEWAASTDYGETFRGIVFDGGADDGLVPTVLLEAARRISGLDEVVPFRAQANAMLGTTGLGRHTDVPEFRGARRWSFPDWLLVTMLHSGCYDGLRIPVVSALVWPIETNGGPLHVHDPSDRHRLASFEPVPDTAVVFDTCRLPHEVGAVPGDGMVPAGGGTIVLTDDGWRVSDTEGRVASLERRQVRASVLIKLACFADAAAREAWAARAEEPLDRDQVVAALAERAGWPGADQALVDHFVSYR